METARVKAIYEEIGEMSVILPQDPQLGAETYRDLLTACRSHQDRVGDLIIEVNRDFARVKILLRGTRKTMEMAGPAQVGPHREKLQVLEDEADELKYLLESLRVKKSNLAGASSDIRLTVGVLQDQIKLGDAKQNRPTADAEKTKFRPPVDAGKVTTIDEVTKGIEEKSVPAPPEPEQPSAPEPVAEPPAPEPPQAAAPEPDAVERVIQKKKTTGSKKPKVAEVVAESAAATAPPETPPAPQAPAVPAPPADVEDLEAFLSDTP